MDTEVISSSRTGAGASEGAELSLGGASLRNSGWRAAGGFCVERATAGKLFSSLSLLGLSAKVLPGHWPF